MRFESSQHDSVSHRRSDREVLGEALNELKGFVYTNGAELTLVSVCWFFCSLPVVTVGPATLGAYTAVTSLYENEGIHASRVFTTVRNQFVGATLLGLFPVSLAGIALLYAVHYLTTGSLLAGIFSLIGAYGAVFALLVLIPTFVSLAHGTPVSQALRRSYLWTVRSPTLALTVGVITAITGCVLLVFVVAFPLLFAGVAFGFHTLVVSMHTDGFRAEPKTETN
jgi:uncharacterized membrane protein YesL